MQPQAHVQVLMNMLDFGLNPQEALDAPRWMWVKEKEVLLEYGFKEHIAEDLIRRGHEAAVSLNHAPSAEGRSSGGWKTEVIAAERSRGPTARSPHGNRRRERRALRLSLPMERSSIAEVVP